MTSFDTLWDELLPLGRDASTGGYRRYAYNAAELECREWFTSTASDRGLDVEVDRNGNLWAWWIPAGVDPQAPALVIGSHLDSVPDGGAFDGPLGVVSSFAALDAVRATGFAPARHRGLRRRGGGAVRGCLRWISADDGTDECRQGARAGRP